MRADSTLPQIMLTDMRSSDTRNGEKLWFASLVHLVQETRLVRIFTITLNVKD